MLGFLMSFLGETIWLNHSEQNISSNNRVVRSSLGEIKSCISSENRVIKASLRPDTDEDISDS